MLSLETIESQIDKEDTCTAYRFLILREAELEDQMNKTLHTQELDLYYKIRMIELMKVQDAIRLDYQIPIEAFPILI